MRAKPEAFLGSIESAFRNSQGAAIAKTTLYVRCSPVGVPPKGVRVKQEKHYGCESERGWYGAPFLIQAMKRQARVLKRSDFDESEVVRRAVR